MTTPNYTDAIRAQRELDKLQKRIQVAQETRREAFRLALKRGGSVRTLAAAVGISSAAVQKAVH